MLDLHKFEIKDLYILVPRTAAIIHVSCQLRTGLHRVVCQTGLVQQRQQVGVNTLWVKTVTCFKFDDKISHFV